MSSAGNTRGLIEANRWLHQAAGVDESSAGNTRGLIEAERAGRRVDSLDAVFRGEYPRPH